MVQNYDGRNFGRNQDQRSEITFKAAKARNEEKHFSTTFEHTGRKIFHESIQGQDIFQNIIFTHNGFHTKLRLWT